MKKILSIILILSFLVSMNIYASSSVEFKDVGNHWAKSQIYNLVNRNIISGYPDGTFRPDNTIKVSEFTRVLTVGLLGFDVGLGKNGPWYQKYVDTAKELKLINDNEFEDYNRNIKRGEMARMIARALTESYPSNKYDYSNQIIDYDTTPNEFKEYILNAYVKGIISGYPDGSFKYDNDSTRAEAISMILRYLEPDLRQVPELKIDTAIVNDKEDDNIFNTLTKKELQEISSYSENIGFHIKDGKIYFNSEDLNVKNYRFDETYIPNANEKAKNIIESLITEDMYTYVNYGGDKEEPILYIKYALGEVGARYYDSYLFKYRFNEVPYNAKADWLQDDFSENVVIDFYLSSLWTQPTDDWVVEKHKNKLNASLISLFGEETGNKIFEYILNEYITDRTKTIEEKRNSKTSYNTRIIDNIKIDFVNESTLKFFFSYVE